MTLLYDRTCVLVLLCVACFAVVRGDPDCNLDRLNEWLRNVSTSPPMVDVALTDGMGVGVVVRDDAKPVKKMSTVFEIPIRATLCRESISRKPYGAFVANENEQDMVILAVMTERALGELSSLAEWLRCVPSAEELQLPAAWSEPEVAQVEPRSLQHVIRSVQQAVRRGYDVASRGPIRKLAAHVRERRKKKGLTESNSDVWSLSAFQWAAGLVDSRAWNIQGKKYFVPGADFFNHAPDDEDLAFRYHKAVAQRSQKFLVFHQLTAVNVAGGTTVPVVRVLSDRPASGRGTQLFESYGDNSNDIYFVYHGFIPRERNWWDCQVMWLGRGLSQLEASAYRDTPLMRLIAQTRGVSDALQLKVCVHEGEVPPLLLLVGWVLAVENRRDTLAQSFGPQALEALTSCAKRAWSAAGSGPVGSYKKDAADLEAWHRTCIGALLDVQAPTAAAAYNALLNVSYGYQRTIAMANAKEEFTTLKATADVPEVPGSSTVAYRMYLRNEMRQRRQSIVRTMLAKMRSQFKAKMLPEAQADAPSTKAHEDL